MAGNKTLSNAKKAKKDEFYTQLVDIENELRHYKEHFRGKIVFCNCDDPRISNFFHYFSYNFEQLGLKKLITTCYKNQNRDLFSQNDSERAIWLEYNGDCNGNRIPDPEEIGINYLRGDGDFRSPECTELLKQADIVVTNPPFSLLNEYLLFLHKHRKKFLVMCNHNVVHYTEIFPLIKNNEMWLGYNSNKTVKFAMPDNYEKWDVIIDGIKYGKVPSIGWITNLDIKKRHEDLILYKAYNEEEYPKYENLNAIDVEKVSDIPYDYFGIMGVPDTLLDQYNPEQFEILGADGIPQYAEELNIERIGEDWMKRYRDYGGTGHYTANMRSLVLTKNNVPKKPYSRILIRRRQRTGNVVGQPTSYKQPEIPLPMAAEDPESYNPVNKED
ncbi:MAG: adenine-specific methyltransferase EcoRI family protein [Bacteroidales bacterium]|nr:adenine-specific methyltransferase EcoRI family protein [Bacteroidales bacterium]